MSCGGQVIEELSRNVELEAEFAILQFKRADVALFALLLYDWIITFQDELAIVWARPFTLPKLFFVLARYLTLAVQSTQMAFGFGNPRAHRLSMITGIFIMTIGSFIFTESLMLLRTIAFYRGNLKVYSVIFFLYIASCIAGIVSLGIWVHSLRCMIFLPTTTARAYYTNNSSASPETMFLDPEGVICDVAAKNQTLILGTFAVLLIWETIITALVLRRAWVESCLCCRHCRNSIWSMTQGSLWALLYKHGFLFYLCTLAVTVANFAFLLNGEKSRLNSLLLSGERTIHALSATRLILFTRLQSRSTDTHPSFATDLQLEELGGDHHHHHHHEEPDHDDEDGKADYSDSEHPPNTLSEIEEENEVELSESSPGTRCSSRTQVVTRELMGPIINVLPPSPTSPGHDRY